MTIANIFGCALAVAGLFILLAMVILSWGSDKPEEESNG